MNVTTTIASDVTLLITPTVLVRARSTARLTCACGLTSGGHRSILRMTKQLPITATITIVYTVLVTPAVGIRAATAPPQAASRGNARIFSRYFRDGHVSKGEAVFGHFP